MSTKEVKKEGKVSFKPQTAKARGRMTSFFPCPVCGSHDCWQLDPNDEPHCSVCDPDPRANARQKDPSAVEEQLAQRQTKKKGKVVSFKPENGASIKPAISELERAFGALLSRFPGLADHPQPRIVIQSRGRKRNALGWFWSNRWKDGRDGEVPAIHENTQDAPSCGRGGMRMGGAGLEIAVAQP